MKSTEEVIEILREFKRTAGEKYGIEQLALFGSTARGEQNENSDIDVCVKPRKAIDYFTLQDIKEELEKLLKCPVDVVRLRNNMDELLRGCINKDGIYV